MILAALLSCDSPPAEPPLGLGRLATTVYDYLARAMPQNAPGSLSPEQTYALVAFLLAANGAVPEDFVADAASLPAVRMPTRIEFVPDDRLEATTFR